MAAPSSYPLPLAHPGIDFPSASDDVGTGIFSPPDAPEDLAALRRVSDAAIGDELFRRCEARNTTGAS
jgi:hypothetical protein